MLERKNRHQSQRVAALFAELSMAPQQQEAAIGSSSIRSSDRSSTSPLHEEQDASSLPLPLEMEAPSWWSHSEHQASSQNTTIPWKPSSSTGKKWIWKDFWHFCGPGWMVCIAYVDPGNYQADIQAGATRKYTLLFCLWWTSLLSIYVQVLCVRLALYAQRHLAQYMAEEYRENRAWMRYIHWAIAEGSTILTDLPEVIGIAIACKVFFGWDYWIGVLLSLWTTMIFLLALRWGISYLEGTICAFVGLMSVALFVEMGTVHPDWPALVRGWLVGFVDLSNGNINENDSPSDSALFAMAGILGSVVMPHNLYLHTATLQQHRPIHRTAAVAPTVGEGQEETLTSRGRDEQSVSLQEPFPEDETENEEDHNEDSNLAVELAVRYASWEPVLPILVSFFINAAVVSIAAERVAGQGQDDDVGLTNFCQYFASLPGGCFFWGTALLAAGQSSAITTTFTGQYVMDGFLQRQLPIKFRATLTRLVAIAPCIVVSLVFPNRLNAMVNFVNAILSILLPFALTPLIKYNCSATVMGPYAAQGVEKVCLYAFAVLVWAVNAVTLSLPGGGFFGGNAGELQRSASWFLLEVTVQIIYAGWNGWILFGSPAAFAGGLAQPLEAEDDGLHSDDDDDEEVVFA